MPGFEITFGQVQPFAGVDMELEQVRVSGTVFGDGTWNLDIVEMPATDTLDGWRILDRLHPIYVGSCLTDGVGHFLDAEPQVRAIEAAVAAVRAAEREEAGVGRRPRYAVAA